MTHNNDNMCACDAAHNDDRPFGERVPCVCTAADDAARESIARAMLDAPGRVATPFDKLRALETLLRDAANLLTSMSATSAIADHILIKFDDVLDSEDVSLYFDARRADYNALTDLRNRVVRLRTKGH